MDLEFRKYSNNDYKELLNMIDTLYNEDPEGQEMDEFKGLRQLTSLSKTHKN